MSWIRSHSKVIYCSPYSVSFKPSFLLFNISFDAVMKMVTVKYQDNEVPYLNELEYINGEVWANVWQVRFLLIIQYRAELAVYLMKLLSISY